MEGELHDKRLAHERATQLQMQLEAAEAELKEAAAQKVAPPTTPRSTRVHESARGTHVLLCVVPSRHPRGRCTLLPRHSRGSFARVPL
eukprot:364548-Prymnesium_polylepis.1